MAKFLASRWKPFLVPLCIVAAVLLWMAGGDIGNEAVRAAAADKAAGTDQSADSDEELFLVTVRQSQAQEFARQIRLSGRTRASRDSFVKAELGSRVLEVLVADGDSVAKDDVLVRLSKETRPAAYESAIAGLQRAKKNYAAVKDLSSKGYQSELEALQAKEALIKAQQEVSQTKKNLDDTTIRAPYGGVIQDLAVEVGETTTVGMVVAQLLDLDPIEIVAFASERELNHIALGQKAEVTLINGARQSGLVQYISASSDKRTGTFEVRIRLDNPKTDIRAGISGSVVIFGEKIQAHFQSKSLLTLNQQGEVGIKSVDDENRVVFHPTKIIEDTEDGVYLSGLPTKARLIVVGQDFVKTNNTVRTKTEE